MQSANFFACGDRIDNDYKNQIVWPQSRMCCDREVALTSEEGGRLIFSIHGLKKACSYIDGEERHSSAGEAALWGGFAAQSAGFFWGENVRHWVRLKTIGWDMGSAGNGGNYMAALDDKNLEIMRFINNLLYPAQPDIGIDKAFFKSMLCDAPCGGPCRKRSDYGDTIAGYANFPEFECPNNPNWIGQRWEEHGNGDTGANRQFNGLDFMALYNLYLLYFPEERTAYFNPDRPQGDIAWGSSNIEGPGVLCPVDTARYKLLHPQPSYVQNLVWTASTNFEVLVSQGLEADIAAKSTIYTPQFVQTSFGENRQIPQFYDGLPGYIDTSGVHAYGDIIDVCDLDYRKIVYTRTPNYTIETEFDHCNADYWFHAVGISPDIPNTTYTWKFEVFPNGSGSATSALTIVATGKDVHLQVPGYQLPGTSGYIITRLTVNTDCGEGGTMGFPFYSCNPGRQVMVAPNPTTTGNQVIVNITNDYVVATGGLNVRFIRASTGITQSTQRIYYNGQPVNMAGFPTGNYTVQVVLEDNTVLTTTLIVSDN